MWPCDFYDTSNFVTIRKLSLFEFKLNFFCPVWPWKTKGHPCYFKLCVSFRSNRRIVRTALSPSAKVKYLYSNPLSTSIYFSQISHIKPISPKKRAPSAIITWHHSCILHIPVLTWMSKHTLLSPLQLLKSNWNWKFNWGYCIWWSLDTCIYMNIC